MKYSFEDLAVNGGAPAFNEKLHVGRPNIGDRDRLESRLKDMIDRRWLSNDGPFVQEFERRVADYVGVEHCIAICNGTVGLEIAIRAAGLRGEVIVPSFTFIATPHALQWQGIVPVFCDIDPASHTLDPAQIEKLITPRTTGIIGVHTWGNPCDIEQLAEIAQRNKLALLYDAAHAFGCSYQGRMVGGFGDAEVFSFHATKFVNAMEGGTIVTDDDDLAARARLMKNFGFTGYDRVEYIGTNGKMNEASGAMGLTSLESVSNFIDTNYRNYQQYRLELDGLPGLRFLAFDESERCNFQYVVLEIDEGLAGIHRDTVQQILWAENILARRYFFPGCHRMQPYLSYFPHAGLALPNTERLVQRVLCLPTGTAVGQEEIMTICRIIRIAVLHGEEISHRLTREDRAIVPA